jgi:hypothetical protein
MRCMMGILALAVVATAGCTSVGEPATVEAFSVPPALPATSPPPVQSQAPKAPRNTLRVDVSVEDVSVPMQFGPFDWVDIERTFSSTGWRESGTGHGEVVFQRVVHECTGFMWGSRCHDMPQEEPEVVPAGTRLTTCPPEEPCQDEVVFITQQQTVIPTGPQEDCSGFFAPRQCVKSDPVPVIASQPGVTPSGSHSPFPGVRREHESEPERTFVGWTSYTPGWDAGPIVTEQDLTLAAAALDAEARAHLDSLVTRQLGSQPGDVVIQRSLDGEIRHHPRVGTPSPTFTTRWYGPVRAQFVRLADARDAVMWHLQVRSPTGGVLDESTVRWELYAPYDDDGRPVSFWPRARGSATFVVE